MSEENRVEEYISYVKRVISEFSDIGDLVVGQEVTPSKINYALSKFYDVSLALNAEYQRQKNSHLDLERHFQVWYDEAFTQAKILVQKEYAENKSIKPSVKEYEVMLRRQYKEEWLEWKKAVDDSEAKNRFLMRLRETLNKYDSILTTLSYNMRGELKALTIDDRSNANAKSAENNKVRRLPLSE